MPDPNPYEPPRQPEPLTTKQIVKRGIGFGAILILTPVATFAAFFASCTATFLVAMGNDSFPEPFFWTLLIAPPALCFAAMTYWAARAYRQQR